MRNAATKKSTAKISTREVFPHGTGEGEVEQGSDEWFRFRLGICTASNFGAVMAAGEGKTRTKLLYDLAGEILTGEPAEKWSGPAMERGKAMEAEAREYYAFTHDVEVVRIGFVRNKLPRGQVIGASPDGFIGNAKGLEIKTQIPRLLIEQLVKGAAMPPEHRVQVQGTMLVCELESMDLMIFYRGMPVAPVFTVERDEIFIKEISDAIEVFDYDLKRLVEKIRAMGPPLRNRSR